MLRAGAANLPNLRAKVHTAAMFDWSDLRHLIAVSRHGSTLAAAKALLIRSGGFARVRRAAQTPLNMVLEAV